MIFIFLAFRYAVADMDGNIVAMSDPSFTNKKLHPGSVMKIVISYALFYNKKFSPYDTVFTSEWKKYVNLEEAIALSGRDYFKKYMNRISQHYIRIAGRELNLFYDTTGFVVDLERNPLVSVSSILRMMITIAKRENLEPYRLQFIINGMRKSVLYGTSKNHFLYSIGVAGKTGTSEYTDNWRTYGIFAGFLPYNNPSYVFVFYVDKGIGRDAVKKCANFMKKWYK